jgi:multifunctional methyltransferase subunit TRM112
VGKKVVNAAKDHGALLLRSKILRLHAFHHTKEKKAIMKVLTLNFLTCAVKACKSSPNSHPLHPKDAELVQDDIDLNPEMIINVLPRLDWQALRTTSSELGFPPLPEQPPTAEELEANEKTLQDLHHLLLETSIAEGKLVCGNCSHEYAIKEGIANFLLPSHLV